MSIELVRSWLGWCAVLDYALLLVWFGAFVLAHDAMYRLNRRWFVLDEQRFDAIQYLAMGLFKCGTLLFALVPWLALQLVG